MISMYTSNLKLVDLTFFIFYQVHLTPLCTIAPKKTNSRKYCSEPDPVLPRISDLVAARMKLTVRKHCSQSGGPSKKDKDEASGADK